MNEQLPDSTLTELLKVAESAASQRKWALYSDGSICAGADRHCIAKLEFPRFADSTRDGRHIAKFDPSTCISLVKELKERRDRSIIDVGWAEEAMKIADVLRKLSAQFNGIDNGHCTICGQHRLYDTRGNKGPCENTGCLSHRIAPILNAYEKPSEELLDQMRQNCLARIRS